MPDEPKNRNGGLLTGVRRFCANIVHVVKSVTNEKSILEISIAGFIAFPSLHHRFFHHSKPLSCPKGLHLHCKTSTPAMQKGYIGSAKVVLLQRNVAFLRSCFLLIFPYNIITFCV